MISTDERERAEKTRSAVAAASEENQDLLMSVQNVNRYLSPPENTISPLEYAFHLLGDVTDKTVLEYGCGDGLNTVLLSKRGAKVIALDLSPELLDLTKRRLSTNQCERAELVLGSAHALPLPDNSVDVVFGIAILHHLDLQLAAQEVHRVLKKGGKGIFQEPLRNSKLLSRIRAFFPVRADVSPFERPLTDQELQDFSSPCKYRGRTFQLMLSRMATLVPFFSSPLERICERIDGNLIRRFPSLAYYGSIKVFEIVKD